MLRRAWRWSGPGSRASERLLELDAELLDDLQMVASEACNNVILHAYGDRPGPLEVRVTATHEGIDILVRDHGTGLDEGAPEADSDALGLAVIRSLADRTELISGADGGTEVHMEFDREIPSRRRRAARRRRARRPSRRDQPPRRRGGDASRPWPCCRACSGA